MSKVIHSEIAKYPEIRKIRAWVIIGAIYICLIPIIGISLIIYSIDGNNQCLDRSKSFNLSDFVFGQISMYVGCLWILTVIGLITCAHVEYSKSIEHICRLFPVILTTTLFVSAVIGCISFVFAAGACNNTYIGFTAFMFEIFAIFGVYFGAENVYTFLTTA